MDDIIIKVDKEKCVGSFTCIHTAQGTFRPGEKGLADVVATNQDTLEDILLAADICPVGAITVERGKI